MSNKWHEITPLHLIQSYCLPSLTYNWSLTAYDAKRFDIAWINAFLKIFSHWYESVKPLQYYCFCLPTSITLPMNKVLFCEKTLACKSIILHVLAEFCRDSMLALDDKYSKYTMF